MNTPSIRNRVLLLVGAMSLLLAGSVGFGIYSDAQQTITSTKRSLRTLANTMASNTGVKISNARQALERLSDHPLIRQVDPNNCDGILKDLLKLNPDYANVTYTNMDGVAVCSAVPQPDGRPVNVGKAPWFQKFLKEKRFIVGDPFFGPITHKWVSVLSAPIWNERREMVGGVQLPLDLQAYDPKIPAEFLPAGSRYGFISADGIVIWRNVDPDGVIGTRPSAEAARQSIAVRDGEFEGAGSDGVTRFISVVPMPETGWVAFVGVPVSEVYAAAKQRALIATVIALAAIALLIALALSITRRITGPLADLEKATRSVLNGNLGAKVATGGPSEVTSVATAFNAMTDKIEASTRLLEIEITEHKAAELALQESEERWKFAIEGAGDGLWDWNVQTGVAFYSPRYKEMYGYADADFGTTSEEWSTRIHPDDAPGVFAALQPYMEGKPGSATVEFRMLCKDGSWKWTLGRGMVVSRDADGKPLRMIGTNADITERKQAEERIRELAFYDPLTKLPNRHLLNDRLSQAMATCTRSGCYGALMFLDLDNFKPLNDTHGHVVGDLLLIEVAERLRNGVREIDTVSRFGGDEFVVVINGLDADRAESTVRAGVIAEKIRRALSEPYQLTVRHEGQADTAIEHHCTVSVGVALFMGHKASQDDILRWADIAMYQAKEAGRSLIRFFDARS